MVNASLRIIYPTLKTKEIKVETSFENDDSIETYHTEVNQVILNIIKNAEDALLDKEIKDPYIEIRVYKKDKKICIDVQDNAGGIPEDIIEKVFDPYFSTKEKKDGTGLGLYMSKTIITEHCLGNIEVKNTKRGACFTISLPLKITKYQKELTCSI